MHVVLFMPRDRFHHVHGSIATGGGCLATWIVGKLIGPEGAAAILDSVAKVAA